jgi:CheY-specific phosphatase CheX
LGAPTFKDTSVIERTEVIICAAIATENLLTNFALCFEKRIFLHLMGKMLGESYSSITPELEDGAKEMMNVVFNQAKKPLAQKGLAGYRSVPQVIFGEGMRIRYLTRGKSILLPFETEMGSFWAEITTQNITISDKV